MLEENKVQMGVQDYSWLMIWVRERQKQEAVQHGNERVFKLILDMLGLRVLWQLDMCVFKS